MPHLRATLQSQDQPLEHLMLQYRPQIEGWFREQWKKTPPPFYCSVDLRNAGFKIAPVDTNLFPAGFNQLHPDSIALCAKAAKDYLACYQPQVQKILLVAESHTRNIHYFENIATLQAILSEAGFEVRVGTLIEQLRAAKTIPLPSQRPLTLSPIVRVGDQLTIENFTPELIILNNDLSEGIPQVLQMLKQTVIPSMNLGWSRRLKSAHFQHYQNAVQDFAAIIEIDPWQFTPGFRYCGEIDFMTREGEDCLVRHAQALLKSIHEKYQQYGVKKEPFLVIKSDKGTYGMAVMSIKSPEAIYHLNRKERVRMSAAKGAQSVSRIIIQEGVHTIETVGDKKASAEPVVYMIGSQVVGGFYRVHEGRGENENLNAPGMFFEPMYFTHFGEEDHFYSYSVVARLALVAASRERAEALS